MRYSQEEIDRAWDIHKDADAIFYQKLSGFLISQSFLIGAFAIVFSVIPDNAWDRSIVAIAISTLGIFTSIAWKRFFKRSLDRLWILKKEYLIQDDVYQFYIDRSHDRQSMSIDERREEFTKLRPKSHEIGDWIPYSLIVFWVLALVLSVGTFRMPLGFFCHEGAA